MSQQPTLIPIAFAITPRMQSFLELRDTLRCLTHAYQNNAPYPWLTAAKELHDLLLGQELKKVATPEVISIFIALQKHFEKLSQKYPQFSAKLNQACAEITQHCAHIRQDIQLATDFLCNDAWLNIYEEDLRRQDYLGHKSALPQVAQTMWFGTEQYGQHLQTSLTSFIQAIEYLDQMLHAHVPWQPRTAHNGADQITLAKHDDIDLIIVGLPKEHLAQGIVPQYAGSSRAIRLRFSQYQAGQALQHIEHNQNYSLMMVSIT